MSTLRRTFIYDSANRMVEFRDDAKGITATYEYGVLGRRIAKSVVFDPGEDNPGVPQGTTRYSLDDRWRILEESNATGTDTAFASRPKKRGGGAGDDRRPSPESSSASSPHESEERWVQE